MEDTCHKVTDNELPDLAEWLHQYLPDSHKFYSTVQETIKGRWNANTFVTLGWPDIRAVGEGPPNDKSECADYFKEPIVTSVYSPKEEDAEALLQSPGFVDWNQTNIFQVMTHKLVPTIEKVANSKGRKCVQVPNVMLQGKPGDITSRPVPEGYEVRPLDADADIDYVLSTWPHARKHADKYVQECIRKFPSVGLFDRNGECIGLEIGTEYSIGMLHVREEYRSQGLGKVVCSQLAQMYFKEDLPVTASVIKTNEPSVPMHLNMGFKKVAEVTWVFSIDGDNLQNVLDSIGYKGKLPVET